MFLDPLSKNQESENRCTYFHMYTRKRPHIVLIYLIIMILLHGRCSLRNLNRTQATFSLCSHFNINSHTIPTTPDLSATFQFGPFQVLDQPANPLCITQELVQNQTFLNRMNSQTYCSHRCQLEGFPSLLSDRTVPMWSYNAADYFQLLTTTRHANQASVSS